MLVIIGRYGNAVRTWKVSEISRKWTGKAEPDSRALYLMILKETRSHVKVFNNFDEMRVHLTQRL